VVTYREDGGGAGFHGIYCRGRQGGRLGGARRGVRRLGHGSTITADASNRKSQSDRVSGK
jgi:hypothetical protein